MNLEEKCKLSYYKEIAVLSEQHCVYLVQHIETRKIYIKKVLSVYNKEIYDYLIKNPIPNTPKIFEMFEDENQLMIIEEYMSGTTLQERMDAGAQFQESEVINLVFALCEIIQKLHSVQPPIVHRDIKPSNIMISQDGVLKLIDMNAAKWENTESSHDTVLMGTVGYAAPEQYGFGTSGVQTDIYAIGALINQLLIGAFPQDRLLYGRLRPLVAKCTKLNPTERYQTIEEFLDDLREITGIRKKKKMEVIWKYTPPGFRSLHPLKMVTAFFGYWFMIYAGLTLEVENVTDPLILWSNRIAFFLLFLLETLFFSNYLDVQRKVGLDRIKEPWLRLLGKGFAGFMIAALVLMPLIMIEALAK